MRIIKAPHRGTLPKADGLVTQTAGLALTIQTADCAPILFADHRNHVIAACHAGWRGALAGICERTITSMQSLGARPEHICAAIGPAISQHNYQVGPEFYGRFLKVNPAYKAFFLTDLQTSFYFDLKAFIIARLKASGLHHIDHHPACTYADPQAYYSYRFSTHNSQTDHQGHNLSTIMRKT